MYATRTVIWHNFKWYKLLLDKTMIANLDNTVIIEKEEEIF